MSPEPEPLPPAGWYPDPSRPGVLRRWNGTAWGPPKGARWKRLKALLRQQPLAAGILGVAALVWFVSWWLPMAPVRNTSDGSPAGFLYGGLFQLFGLGAGSLADLWLAQFMTFGCAFVGLQFRLFRWLPLLGLAGVAMVSYAIVHHRLEIPNSLGGSSGQLIPSYSAGYFVWIASLVLLAVAPWTVKRAPASDDGGSRA